MEKETRQQLGIIYLNCPLPPPSPRPPLKGIPAPQPQPVVHLGPGRGGFIIEGWAITLHSHYLDWGMGEGAYSWQWQTVWTDSTMRIREAQKWSRQSLPVPRPQCLSLLGCLYTCSLFHWTLLFLRKPCQNRNEQEKTRATPQAGPGEARSARLP